MSNVVAWIGSARAPIIRLTLTVLLVGGWSIAAVAQEAEEEEHQNEVALIIAGTYEDEATVFTIGIEYERRFHQYLGFGGAIEYLVDGRWLFVFPVAVHPIGGLKLLAGPGFEREDGENSFIFRVGADYSFEFADRFSLTPGLDVDFIGRDGALVFGVDFGVSF